MPWHPLHLTVRVGCRLVYEITAPTPATFVLKPRLDENILINQEIFTFGIGRPSYAFEDGHGNTLHRIMLMPGRNEILHDAVIRVPSRPDPREMSSALLSVDQLPFEVLRYTLPSRYCDSDRLMDFAWQHFGQVPHGLPRVLAIADWIFNHLEYRFGADPTNACASEVLASGHGVCRDFAHVMISLCRAFNLPARYVTGHLPDIDAPVPDIPMDFHAYCEVYLGHEWLTFDARFPTPRIGRVKVAHGMDAVDGAFSTIYGQANMTHFEVWAYQVDPRHVSVGDPIDLTLRVDGQPGVHIPQ